MSYIVVGLGNKGDEYEGTRHNTGRMFVDRAREEYCGDEFKEDKKSNSLLSSGKIGKEKILFIAPNNFMNNSGKSVAFFVKSTKAAGKLIVAYDDFSLPIGSMRISYNRSSGGHNGLESVIKAIKTKAFIRIRIGIAPANKKGEAKILHGQEEIVKFILGKYKDEEMKILKKVINNAVKAIEIIVKEGKEKAMTSFNGN